MQNEHCTTYLVSLPDHARLLPPIWYENQQRSVSPRDLRTLWDGPAGRKINENHWKETLITMPSWLQRFVPQTPPSWDNRRRGPRLALRLPLQLESKAAELINISEDGLRLSTAGSLPPGRTVVVCPGQELNPIGRRRARCQVVWCRRHQGIYQVGLAWSDPDSWIQSVWQRIRPEWRTRRHLRIHCQFPVQVKLPNGRVLEGARCLDMSPGGCLLRLEGWIAAGTRLSLAFGPDHSLLQEGEVLEVESGRIHVRFRGPENKRLRGFLSNLKAHHGECPGDPPVELPRFEITRPIVAPFTPPLKECGPAPRPRSLEQICGDRLGLPQVLSPLKLRQMELRSPSLWAARQLPLLPATRR